MSYFHEKIMQYKNNLYMYFKLCQDFAELIKKRKYVPTTSITIKFYVVKDFILL